MKRPSLKELHVEIDGAHCFGEPRVEGHRIPVQCLVSRFIAGETRASLIEEYEITEEQFDGAVRFALLGERRFRKEIEAAAAECKRIWNLDVPTARPT